MKHIVKWGIIGLGNIAHHFAKSFYNLDNAKLVAVASNSKEKLLRFKENHHIKSENLYNNYDEILEDNNLDIIYIALPNNLHFEWALKGIEKKKNILVEKPAFTSTSQVEQIFSHNNFQSIFFSEGYMYKYHPQFIETIKILKSGEIGKPIDMKVNCGTNLIYKKNFLGFKKKKIDKNKRIFNKKIDGGVISDLGCYTSSASLMIASIDNNIDISNFSIKDTKTEYLDGNIDVHSTAIINFDNKFISSIKTSFKEEIGNDLIVRCENGEIKIGNTWNPSTGNIKILGKKERELKFQDTKNIYSLEIHKISEDIINNRKEASFPGTTKRDILLNTKIINNWLNEY